MSAGPWLLAAAVVCEALSVGASRFSFELCHQGIPLLFPVMVLPIAGTLCALASLAFAPKKTAHTATKAVVALANSMQLASGAMILASPGLVSC